MTNTRFAKLFVAMNCALPAILLGWDAYQRQLGANPINDAIKTTGLLALIFLSLSLLITPVRKLTGWNSLVLYRRTLGLAAFFYALGHFSIYFIFDRAGSISSTFKEILARPYLVIGSIALLAMLPLAITSANAMVKALGAKRWAALHQLTYLAIVAGTIHYYLQAKSDKRQPTAFIIAAIVLLAYRWISQFFKTPAAAIAARPVVQTLAQSQSAPRPKFWTGQLRVIQTSDETPDVRTFRLAMPDGSPLPFAHLPGQYLNLSLTIEGKRINRSYTIASSPSQPNYCELTIKREKLGAGSRHLHDMIHQGDLLSVSAPAGKFVFTGDEAKSIVLIGGGVGITPLMSVIRYLTDRNWPGEIYLIYSAKTRDDVIFGRELTNLQKRFPNLHVTCTLTGAAEQDWSGARGRISPELLTRSIPNIATQIFHLCGPTSMMEPVRQMLLKLGAAENRIKTEEFKSPVSAATIESFEAAQIPQVNSSVVPTITFASSNRAVPAPSPTTVLEAAESAGVNIEFECRSGICGTCKTRLLSGRVQMETRDALSQSEVDGNIILACQARPLEDVTVQA